MTHKDMNTFERIAASENESYTDMMNFEMQDGAKCDMSTEASRLITSATGGYFADRF
jgi:hypothetical protein